MVLFDIPFSHRYTYFAMDKPDYFRRDDFDEQQYESLIVQAGIAAVKAKDYEQGISLLLKATQMREPGDARPGYGYQRRRQMSRTTQLFRICTGYRSE